jgi:hypothetical protein
MIRSFFRVLWGMRGTAAEFCSRPPGGCGREGEGVRQDRHSGGWGTAWLSLLLGGLTVGTGCTMCPSPFDYSGTVPGAADQNDFRVRNNGILPIWKRPRPWPPVVTTEPVEDQPATAEPAARRIAAATVQATDGSGTLSVLLTAAAEEPVTSDNVVPAAHTTLQPDPDSPAAGE